jgi:hAT family C-terminal dimerisation region
MLQANRRALDLMKVQQPTWLLLGCQAHALALLIKDLQGEKTARCEWSKKAYAKALMMSNTINGSETVHSALREQQMFKYGKVKAVRTHCPTRFAILHFICSDLLDSEEAIRLMVGARSWGNVSDGCTHAVEFTGAATVVPARGRAPAYFFFDEAAALVQLVQPVSDAIHQLESDKPLLSQMLPIWKQLLKHAKDFDDHEGNASRSAVLPLFERRYATHRDKSWPAAFVLDPIHAVKADGEWFLPFSELDAKEAEAATRCILQLAGKENLSAVTDELTKMQLAPLPQAMQHALPTLTRRTPLPNGKVQLVDSGMRRGWWQTIARPHFPHLSRVAVRLLSFHVTACASERNWSLWGNVYPKCRSNLAIERGGKLVFIKGNDKAASDKTDEEVMLTLMEEPGA